MVIGLEDRKPEEVKEIVKRYYGSRWSSGAQCCQPSIDEESSGSCQCGSSSPNDVLQSPKFGLMDELSPRPGMRILDVGSGTGETVLEIAAKVAPGGLAVGVDFSEEGIAAANEKVKQRKLEEVAEFRLGDAERLPFADETFDAVVSECVVCLVPDKQRALNEKVRVLRPGGRVIMHDVVRWLEMPEAMRVDPALYCGCVGGAVTVDEYRGMMEEAGLGDIKVVDYTDKIRTELNASILAAAAHIKEDDQFTQVINFVRKGGIGYALFSGTKPDDSKQGNEEESAIRYRECCG